MSRVSLVSTCVFIAAELELTSSPSVEAKALTRGEIQKVVTSYIYGSRGSVGLWSGALEGQV
jgi:hypothetical protein